MYRSACKKFPAPYTGEDAYPPYSSTLYFRASLTQLFAPSPNKLWLTSLAALSLHYSVINNISVCMQWKHSIVICLPTCNSLSYIWILNAVCSPVIAGSTLLSFYKLEVREIIINVNVCRCHLVCSGCASEVTASLTSLTNGLSDTSLLAVTSLSLHAVVYSWLFYTCLNYMGGCALCHSFHDYFYLCGWLIGPMLQLESSGP